MENEVANDSMVLNLSNFRYPELSDDIVTSTKLSTGIERVCLFDSASSAQCRNINIFQHRAETAAVAQPKGQQCLLSKQFVKHSQN